MPIKFNYKIEKDLVIIFPDEFTDHEGELFNTKLKITPEMLSLKQVDLVQSWINKSIDSISSHIYQKTNEPVIKLTEDLVSSIAYEVIYPSIERLKDIKEICRLLECQQEDYNQRNFGDAGGWDRHIRKAQEDFEEKYNQSPWDFMRNYIKSL